MVTIAVDVHQVAERAQYEVARVKADVKREVNITREHGSAHGWADGGHQPLATSHWWLAVVIATSRHYHDRVAGSLAAARTERHTYFNSNQNIYAVSS
jgi:hypothetical protein